MSILNNVTRILDPIWGRDDGRNSDDYFRHSGRDDYSKHGKDDYSKHAKNDDCSDDGRKDGDWKHAGKDDYSKHAKNDDCQPHKDYCQPQKDYCDAKPSDDCGKGNTYSPGEALAKFDFSHGNFGSHGPDHSSDMQGALASMPSGHALDYAIGQMGPDHFDVGHFDMPTDTHNVDVHHA
ncbi:hypothetical protein QCM80_42730 [Bradyrhizobium sp. SSUT112]|uniref:hypothetical protein n=1 Tax=Bradyrhizobium sp. SSUT112 TaxID=3040604 RepID=UPI00244BA52F|nr:hypothetical protein [Bradyrhizobium sp. SSUT112]MDH2357237.1 hypothetical protein [Bradyrhizobium sp. SSUT112]